MSNVVYLLQDPTRVSSMEMYVTGRERTSQISGGEQEEYQQKGEKEERREIQMEPATKSVEVQTDYRDSEAQTDPYTPACIVKEGEEPEVLSLSHLIYGNGLPASIDEMEIIEQNREKSFFEHALPPTSDEASFMLRRKLMEEQEFREWNKRENEIKNAQNERLQLLHSALIEREKEVEENNAQRIEGIKIRKTENKNRLIAKIQRKKIKILRKMLKRKKDITAKTNKRDIIEEYANFGSKVYAAITREGISVDKIANKYEVQPLALTTHKGITELGESLKPSILETRLNVIKMISDVKKNYTRQELSHKNELKKAQEKLDGKTKKSKVEVKEARRYSLSQIKTRPKTPEIHYYEEQLDPEIQEEEEARKRVKLEQKAMGKSSAEETVQQKRKKKMTLRDNREKAVILLQRLIRGRAMQNIMYEGKEKRLALIEELLTVANIKPLEPEEAEDILKANHEERVQNAMLEGIKGQVFSQTLDELSKELLRFKQQRKISKMMETAERDRRLREVEESGRRQAEINLQKREQVLYEEIMQVHQTTVDSYLSWIFSSTLDKAAGRQALIMAKLRKEKVENKLEPFETKLNKQETVIRDLVSSFLIPNIQRDKLQKRIELEEKRFFEAAKTSMVETLNKTATKLKDNKNK